MQMSYQTVLINGWQGVEVQTQILKGMWGLKKPFILRMALCFGMPYARKWPTGLPLFGDGRVVSVRLCIQVIWHQKWVYPDKRGVRMRYDKANADLCHLVLSSKHISLQNSSSSSNTNTSTRNGSALHKVEGFCHLFSLLESLKSEIWTPEFQKDW